MWAEKCSEGNPWMQAASRFNRAAIELQSAGLADKSLAQRVASAAREYDTFLDSITTGDDPISGSVLKYEKERTLQYLNGRIPYGETLAKRL